jgi:uncharacterized membrane protein YphA (DoxX/SURF4 family)
MALGIELRASLVWVGLLRMVNGGLFLMAAFEKLKTGFRGPELKAVLQGWSNTGRTFGFAREWLSQYVAPRFGDVAFAVTAGEVVAGASLLVGFASRLGALVGLLLNIAYFLASRETINLLMAVVNLAVLVSGGGRSVGLDGPIKQRHPHWLFG